MALLPVPLSTRIWERGPGSVVGYQVTLPRILPIVALALCGCARHVPARIETAPDYGRAGERCAIVGNGELALYPSVHHVFEVFSSPTARQAGLRINSPDRVPLSWSKLPQATSTADRARVDLMGNKLLRLTGWTTLQGRAFQVRAPALVVPSHVWIFPGYPVRLLGMDREGVVVEVETGWKSPAVMQTRTPCSNIAYDGYPLPSTSPAEPALPCAAPSPPCGQGEASEARLDVFESPESFRILTILLHPNNKLEFDVIGAQDGWARIRMVDRGIGLDGWVTVPSVSSSENGLSFSTAAVNIGAQVHGFYPISGPYAVARNAQLYVGQEPVPWPDAVIEQGALIVVGGEQRGDLTQFEFDSQDLGPLEGQRFWINTNAVDKSRIGNGQ